MDLSVLSLRAGKERIISFLWQHLLLIVSLYILALGVVLCVRSELGSSVISSCPLAFSLAGAEDMAPALTLGDYTNCLNVILVICQIIILRRRFQAIQLLQLVIGVLFGLMIDANMSMTASLDLDGILPRALCQIGGCTIMAFGICMEIRCGSITMPGEGLPAALSASFGKSFSNMKIIVDISLVIAAATASLLFFGHWMWNVVGAGTIFAMVYVGAAVRFMSSYFGWFEFLLAYRPGFRRYLFGLAKLIRRDQG